MSRNNLLLLLLMLVAAILLIPGLGNTPLWIYDEVRNAECAREMYERNDWIVPTFNGELRTLKPPLHYFFMFAGFELFGITEWGARFFSTLMGLFTFLITYLFVKKHSSANQALITCLILLSSTHFLFQFRMSVPDPYLIFFNVASIFTAYSYFKEKKIYWLLLSAVCFGLGTLAKGPVAIALPGIAIFLWLLWEQKLNEIFSWKILLALLIVIAVATPWFWLVNNATNGEWTKGFFLEHNVKRFSSPMEGHSGLFIIVPLFVFLGLLPASVFIGESLKNFKQQFKDSFLKMALCVLVIFILFYSISGTKLPNYPMPCYPFLAIILGHFFTTILECKNRTKNYPSIILLFVNLALPIAAFIGIKNEIATSGMENIAIVFALLTTGSFIGFWFNAKNNFKKSLIGIFIFYFLFNILFFNWVYPKIYNQNPMSKTIATIKKFENVVAYQIFHPSFAYYLPNRVPVYYSLDSLQKFLSNNKAVVISRSKFSEELKKINLKELAVEHDIFESSTTVVYTNQK
ncbi:MAG: glycosyltransferase family 39 protein [Chitinophagaceae bacterium]|nr:MAG: glycosyltransferase family 39 protein [Chitinophagaceae bacterium]